MSRRASNITWHARPRSPARTVLATSGPGEPRCGSPACPGRGNPRWPRASSERLVIQGRSAYRLDGDNLRTGLNGDLGFSRQDREENVRRAAEVALLFADAGVVAVVALISPYAESRRRARQLHEEAGLVFLEVYMAAQADVCARRDPKGLYAKASTGELGSFTGVDDPYEVTGRPGRGHRERHEPGGRHRHRVGCLAPGRGCARREEPIGAMSASSS